MEQKDVIKMLKKYVKQVKDLEAKKELKEAINIIINYNLE